MRRIAFLLLFLPLLCGAATAQSITVQPAKLQIAIVEYGLYDAAPGQKIADPTMPSGTREIVSDLRLTRVTNIVPGEVETAFGIRYEVTGGPQSGGIPVTIVTRFPNPGMRNPQTGKTAAFIQEKYKLESGWEYATGFAFDKEWEIVPGVWSFEIWYDGKKMAEQKFTVTLP